MDVHWSHEDLPVMPGLLFCWRLNEMIPLSTDIFDAPEFPQFCTPGRCCRIWKMLTTVCKSCELSVSLIRTQLYKGQIMLSNRQITIQGISDGKMYSVIQWIETYPVDSVIQPLNNQARFSFHKANNLHWTILKDSLFRQYYEI